MEAVFPFFSFVIVLIHVFQQCNVQLSSRARHLQWTGQHQFPQELLSWPTPTLHAGDVFGHVATSTKVGSDVVVVDVFVHQIHFKGLKRGHAARASINTFANQCFKKIPVRHS